jgi:hypothetical protein
MTSAVFERQQGQSELALKTVTITLSKYPKFATLYMFQGQIHRAANNYSAARAAYAAEIKAAERISPYGYSLAEKADGKSIRARALLEKARLVNRRVTSCGRRQSGSRSVQARPSKGRRCLRARCKNAQHPAYSSRWQSGQRPGRNARRTVWTCSGNVRLSHS